MSLDRLLSFKGVGLGLPVIIILLSLPGSVRMLTDGFVCILEAVNHLGDERVILHAHALLILSWPAHRDLEGHACFSTQHEHVRRVASGVINGGSVC